MPTERDIVQLLREIGTRLDCEVSLDVLAARAGWSRFHFHRAFRSIVGETPKRYTNRLRLMCCICNYRVAVRCDFARPGELCLRCRRRHQG